MRGVKFIGFDADDTLWVNEPLYQEAEKKYHQILAEYGNAEFLSAELLKTEKNNIDLYGFGVKSFTLSMIENSLRISSNKIEPKKIKEIIELGKGILKQPVILLEGVKEVLEQLSKEYILIVATKGDLLDQERKLELSGLSGYFHHIEIMSDKREENYLKLLRHLEADVNEFVMVGNSLKSDIIPIVKLGAHAIHVPFHTTWEHEKVNEEDLNDLYYHKVNTISEITNVINS